MAARKPCKRGKVRRRVKGGRMMCVVKKKTAPKRKAERKSRARKRPTKKQVLAQIARHEAKYRKKYPDYWMYWSP